MVTLFRCATMEDWTDVMYVSMYGCNMYHYGNDEDIGKCENSEAFGMSAAMCTSRCCLSVAPHGMTWCNRTCV
jgi:hypothetical protein